MLYLVRFNFGQFSKTTIVFEGKKFINKKSLTVEALNSVKNGLPLL